MKLSKFAKLVKQSGSLMLIHVAGGGLWLSNGYGVYRASGLPEGVDKETILAVLDFDSKTAERVRVQEKQVDSVLDVLGLDLSDSMIPDIRANQTSLTVVYKGALATALLCQDGELVFYNQAFAYPLTDVFKESDYAETVVRRKENGERYVVIRDGVETVAAILPLQVLNRKFLTDLQDFEQRCAEQFARELRREHCYVQQEEAETAEQISMEVVGDED